MPRAARAAPDDSGSDSFLDVVTNIVGILIILVMVIGARIGQLALDEVPAAPEVEALEDQIESLAQTVASTEGEIENLQEQARTVATAAAFASDTRLQLAEAVAAGKAELAARREAWEAARIARAEAETRSRELEEEIERVERETGKLAHAPQSTEEVLAYPTPIGRTVNGEEIHFRVARGHVAYIPLEELFGLARQQTPRRGPSVVTASPRVETVGPAQDFRLDYVIETQVDQARGQVLVRSREWVVRPEVDPVGEPLEEALEARSRFRSALAAVKPDTTVTFWCYPDSFAAYRRLREEMHRLGIPTAARPLPEGAPIGGSTEGSKSVVQ